MKVVIAGGGSTYTPGIVNAIISHKTFKAEEIFLYDNDKSRNERMYLIVKELLKINDSDVILNYSQDPEEAFKGAACIFSQIRVGKMAMREQDEKIPLSHGLVGQETCGLGGLSYGLRAISGMLEIAGYVDSYCKDAWIFNYTNPEAIIADALYQAYPYLKIYNLCDMTISIIKALTDSFGLDFEKIDYEYFGLNHFGWFTSIKEDGKEIEDDLIEKIKKEGLKAPSHDQNDPSWVHTYAMVRDIVEEFDQYIPNTYLQYYLMPEESMKYTDPKYTRANQVMDGREKNIEEVYQDIVNNNEKNLVNDLKNTIHGSYIVDVADAVLNNKKTKAAVIVKNDGIIRNFREDAFIEVMCQIEGEKIEPIKKGFEIENFYKGLMENQNACEKLLIKGYYEKSYQKVLQSFTLNRTCPDMKTAKKILDEFIEVNGDYYPQLN